MRSLIIVGTGGSARDTYSVVAAINDGFGPAWRVLGCVASQRPDWTDRASAGLEYLGSDLDPDILKRTRGALCSVGIGDPAVRRAVTGRLEALGFKFATIVHPTASIGVGVNVGEGTVVYANTVATTNVDIGRSCQVNVGSTLSHDVRVGDFVSISPGVTVAGNVTIEEGAFLGAGATIIPGVTVGAHSVVGAGATVIRDVPAHATVVGVPARRI